MDCPSCHAANRDLSRFCNACGLALASEPALEAERRQIAVVFCDLAGSTELASRFDAEDFSAIVRRYHERCAEIVRALSGHVAQCLGDGVLAYFGYPISHENDALLAVRAGLRLVTAIKNLNAELRIGYGIDLKIRVGIHAGVVVMADVGIGPRRERLALGSVPNLAARIQGVAAPDSVLISEDVQRLTAGYIRTTQVPGVKLRGFESPTTLYEATGEAAIQSRFEIASASGLTPFVGNQEEIDRLLSAWHAAETGEFRILMLEGDPGIGKSRRVHMLKDAVKPFPHRLLELQCTPETSQSAFYPVSAALRAKLLAQEDAPPTLVERLARALTEIGVDPVEAMPLLAPLLAIPLDGAYAPTDASPFKARDLTLTALSGLLCPPNLAEPSLVIVEDIHWADASTLELVQRMLSHSPSAPALIVLTRRSDFELALQPSAALELLTIRKLSKLEARRIAAHVAGSSTLPPSSLEVLLERSDGVPLFIEELTKTLLETGALSQEPAPGPDPDAGDEIPPSVRGLLGSRLDRMGGAKAVLQLGAVLGRQFHQDLLEAVSPLVDLRVRDHLRELSRVGLLFADEDGMLSFRHALIRDAAYGTLLKATRRQFHERTADVLLEQFPTRAAAQPELVAQHYDRAARPDRAVSFWIAAGERALGTNAHREAAGHAQAGLAALAQLNESTEHRRWELELRSILGMALIATEGYGSTSAEQNFTRAEQVISALSKHVGPTAPSDFDKEFVTTWVVWAYHLVRSQLQSAQRSADQLHALATRSQRAAFALETHVSRGLNYFYFAADYPRALGEFDAALAKYEPALHVDHAVRFGQDPKAVAVAVAIWIDAMTGQLEVAERRLAEGLEHTKQRGHPFSEAYLASHAAALYYLIRDHESCRRHAEHAVAVGTKYGFPTWLAVGAIYRGWARGVQGEAEAGLHEIESHLGIFGPIGLSLYGPTRLEILSQARERCGDLEGALAAVSDALDRAERTGERWYQSELERRRGELELRLKRPAAQVETRLRQALALAQAHGNHLFVLRSATTLAHARRELAAVRPILEAALNVFPKECSIPDVQEARALLSKHNGRGSVQDATLS